MANYEERWERRDQKKNNKRKMCMHGKGIKRLANELEQKEKDAKARRRAQERDEQTNPLPP